MWSGVLPYHFHLISRSYWFVYSPSCEEWDAVSFICGKFHRFGQGNFSSWIPFWSFLWIQRLHSDRRLVIKYKLQPVKTEFQQGLVVFFDLPDPGLSSLNRPRFWGPLYWRKRSMLWQTMKAMSLFRSGRPLFLSTTHSSGYTSGRPKEVFLRTPYNHFRTGKGMSSKHVKLFFERALSLRSGFFLKKIGSLVFPGASFPF